MPKKHHLRHDNKKCPHTSGSSAHTHQNTNSHLLCGLGWGGVGGVGIITNLGALPGHDDPLHWPDVQLHQIFLWAGWGGARRGGAGRGGVGWGGVGWVGLGWVGWDGGGMGVGVGRGVGLHCPDLPCYKGGVVIITNLGALPGHEDPSTRSRSPNSLQDPCFTSQATQKLASQANASPLRLWKQVWDEQLGYAPRVAKKTATEPCQNMTFNVGQRLKHWRRHRVRPQSGSSFGSYVCENKLETSS